MKILTQTKDGMRTHGQIKDNEFIRNIEPHHVRWSDKSFCINTYVIPVISKTKNCVFIYKKASVQETRVIPTEKALQYPKTTNEHGEVNIRIPIEDTELIHTKKRRRKKNQKIVEMCKRLEENMKPKEEVNLTLGI